MLPTGTLYRVFLRSPALWTILLVVGLSLGSRQLLHEPLVPSSAGDWMISLWLSGLLWFSFDFVRELITSKHLRIVLSLLCAPLLACGLSASTMLYARLGEYLQWGMIRYAFASGAGSTQGFVTTYTTPGYILLMCVLSLLIGVIWWRPPRLKPAQAKARLGLASTMLLASIPGAALLTPYQATTADAALMLASVRALSEPTSEPLATTPPDPARKDALIPQTERPDLVLVIHESLGTQHLTWYGADTESMPWLAGQLQDDQQLWHIAPTHFTVSSTTHLSVPAIWTGVHTSQPLARRSQATPLWQWAKQAGYQTVLATSQCYSWGEFARYIERAAPDIFIGCEDFPDAHPVNDAGIDELRVTGALEEHLSTLDPERPLLLIYNSNALHQPFQTRSRHISDDFASLSNSDYHKALRIVDTSLSRLIEQLDAHRTHRPRVTVMTADHGERPDPEHRVPRVESYYDEFVRIPALWKFDTPSVSLDIFTHNLSHHNTSNLDITPTLLGLMGYNTTQISGQLDGVDLMRHRLDGTRILQITNVGPARQWHHRGELFVQGSWRMMQSDITGKLWFDVSRDPAQLRPKEQGAAQRALLLRACSIYGARSVTCTAR